MQSSKLKIKKAALFCIFNFAFLIGLSSCNWKLKPTYHADSVASDLRKICAKEYKLRVETRRLGNTLEAYFLKTGVFRPGLATGQAGLQEMRPESAEALEGILLCATRISLSTDAPLEFLEVRLADLLTGATVTLWRFVPDIRDSMYERMAEEEYLNRLVIEVDNKGQARRKREWSELGWDPPMTMARFLAKQVVHRAQRESREKAIDLQAHEDLSKPATLLVVLDNWPTLEKLGEKQTAKVADIFRKTTRMVVGGYRFKGFREFVLQDSRGSALGRWPL